MSNYLTDHKEATTFLHENDFSTVLHLIKREVKKEKWNGYGWIQKARDTKNLIEFLKIFNIILKEERDGLYKPIFDDVYYSDFLKELKFIVEPYMTEGELFLCDLSYKIIRMTFGKNTKFCEWKLSPWPDEKAYIPCTKETHILECEENPYRWNYCPYCRKRIKIGK